MPNQKERGKYPNNLRVLREERLLSRDQLAELTERLALEDSVRYKALSPSTVKSLELGWTRPRMSTALVLSTFFGKPVDELFPAGLDDGNRRS
jgi:DNA-binding XRE family transcriptional regulator